MKIRELLQIEIWSKRTTRKILIGFGIVVVGIGLWFYFDAYCLTRGERNSARMALLQIDSLQIQASGLNDKDFDARIQQTQGYVETAEHSAWTSRDKIVSSTLSGYLSLIKSEREELEQRKLMQERNVSLAKSEQDMNEKSNLSGIQVRSFLSVVLHSSLDK